MILKKLKYSDKFERIILRKIILFLFLFIFSVLFSEEKALNRIKISGNENFKRSEIRGQLRMKSLPFRQRIAFWIKNPEFQQNIMQQDADNILLYLQSNGFLYAEVEAIATENRNGRIDIEYRITENHPVLINSVTVVINDTLRVEREIRQPSLRNIFQQRRVEAQSGNIFRDEHIQHDINFLNDEFVARGFLRSTTGFNIELHEDSLKVNSTVDIEYHIQPERRYYIKEYEIIGNRNVDTATVRNQIVFRDSMVYRAEYVAQSRENLMRLGVFRSIQIFPNFIDDTQFVYPTVRFIERSKWVTTAGVGYGSEEYFRFFMNVSHHGMYKKADQQQLSFRTSYIEPWNFQFRLIQPAFFHPRLNLTVNPFVRRENEPTFLMDRYGNTTSLSYLFLNNWNANFSYLVERKNLLEWHGAEHDRPSIYSQSTYFTHLDINYSMPRMNPQVGVHFLTGVGLVEQGFDSILDYYFLSQEIRYYQPVREHFVFAFRGQMQTMSEIWGFDTIPEESRLFLGGIQSVRGYGRSSISPKGYDSEGVLYSIGGRSSMLFNLEARIPLFENFNTALLYDTGQVLENPYQYDIKRMSQSLGVGVRYLSPIGIVRLDLAKAINRSDSIRYYLTIGESF